MSPSLLHFREWKISVLETRNPNNLRKNAVDSGLVKTWSFDMNSTVPHCMRFWSWCSFWHTRFNHSSILSKLVSSITPSALSTSKLNNESNNSVQVFLLSIPAMSRVVLRVRRTRVTTERLEGGVRKLIVFQNNRWKKLTYGFFKLSVL